ncbi:hypothetical protein OGAPHI_003632 [Ogataea philodendri]|uniref:Uncharacterized protein n=1 Tax=Ogataea philodendri TaxID=1378263 RepID=A0A9P8T405_9ASCO|nr:uncharacterized protein OGAPHI_003632 [Ogataea philodendri]KAH3665448.1 hypothetical protein OGAPHI_003632 [Ogataea philodendri]
MIQTLSNVAQRDLHLSKDNAWYSLSIIMDLLTCEEIRFGQFKLVFAVGSNKCFFDWRSQVVEWNRKSHHHGKGGNQIDLVHCPEVIAQIGYVVMVVGKSAKIIAFGFLFHGIVSWAITVSTMVNSEEMANQHVPFGALVFDHRVKMLNHTVVNTMKVPDVQRRERKRHVRVQERRKQRGPSIVADKRHVFAKTVQLRHPVVLVDGVSIEVGSCVNKRRQRAGG